MFTTQSNLDRGKVLRARGFDTVYFDQAGAGMSSRLNIKDMTAARAIADLEALRVHMNAETMVLWGQSSGASLAAAYSDRHADRVAGLIITSPGALPGNEAERNYSRTARGTDDATTGRLLVTVALLSRNPKLAESFTSQSDSGALFDKTVNEDLHKAAYCPGQLPANAEVLGGGNLFVNRLVSKDFQRLAKPSAHSNIATLILRGSCDYNEASIAESYASRFGTRTAVTVIQDAGHGLFEKPADVDAALSAFVSQWPASVW